jgi:MYXO-CTERM domain-containing protein
MEFQMRNKTFISSMVGIAAVVAVAGSANASTVDTNGGASWGGWNAYGNSDADGVYGTGTNGVVYKIYQTVFRYDSQTMSLGAGYTGSSFSGGDGFQYNNLIYGLGVERVSGTGNMGTRTIGFDLGNDSYQAANAPGGAKVSTSSWSQYRDFNTQFLSGSNSQIGVQLGNNPGPGGSSNFAYSGSVNSQNFAFRAAGNGLNTQMFFDITAMNTLYTQANAFSGWTVGINNIPNGALSPNQFRMSLDIGMGNAARTFIQSSDIWAAELPPIPAPGAIALLGVAGLVGGRRRRA